MASHKRTRQILAIFAGGLVALLATVLFLSAGYFLAAPAEPPQQAELIAVLGGGYGNRERYTVDLYRQEVAPFILLTGLERGTVAARKSALHWRSKLMIERGVPKEALLFDDLSGSSWQDALNTLALMRAKSLSDVVVVSDPPHMRRLAWVFEKVFAGSGKRYRIVAAPMNGWDVNHWWSDEESAEFVISEYFKLGYYFLVH